MTSEREALEFRTNLISKIPSVWSIKKDIEKQISDNALLAATPAPKGGDNS